MSDEFNQVLNYCDSKKIDLKDHFARNYDSFSSELKKEIFEYIFSNFSGSEISNYFSLYRFFLNEIYVRDFLFFKSNHYIFVWTAQNTRDFSLFLDDDMIKRILNDGFCKEKLQTILCFCNNLSNFLSYDEVIEKIYSCNLGNFFMYLDYDSARYVMNYIIKNDMLYNFSNFNNGVQNEFLKNNYFREVILSSRFLSLCVNNIDRDGFNLLVYDDRFKKVLLSSNLDFIKKCVLNDISFPLDVSLDDKFKSIFLDVSDVQEYRSLMNKFECENVMSADEIDDARDKDYDFIISDFKDGYSYLSRVILSKMDKCERVEHLISENLRSFCLNRGTDVNKDSLYDYDSILFKNILIDRFFKDIPYNFLKNVGVMMGYIDKVGIERFDKKRYFIYKNILNFDKLSFDDRMKLYEECRGISNLTSLFYDDYRMCRDHSYSSLIGASFLNKSNFSLEKSNRYGANVFELNGEEFFAFVHITDILKEDALKRSHDIWKGANREYLSLSYIGNKNLSVYKNPHDFIMLGFTNLDHSRIVHLYESDSFSCYGYNNKDASSFVQKMYNPEDFVNNTRGYNEVVYLEDSKDVPLSRVMPSYVVCYDKITNGDVYTAKLYNLPIVLINTKKYKFGSVGLSVDADDEYVL